MSQRTYGFLFAFFATVFAGSAALLIWYGEKSHRQAAVYGQLAAAVQRADPAPTQAGEGTPLDDYRALSEENPDMVGWIRIDGTNIDYPVVQCADEPNYYLKHDFAGRYTDFGCPFAQANCDVQDPSDNVILYGHNMKDGSMFSDLVRYQSRSFWETHRTIHFDTPAVVSTKCWQCAGFPPMLLLSIRLWTPPTQRTLPPMWQPARSGHCTTPA